MNDPAGDLDAVAVDHPEVAGEVGGAGQAGRQDP